VTAALETLMLAFQGDDSLPIPSRALFLSAQPHPALCAWPDLVGWQPLKPLADAWEHAGFKRVDVFPDTKWPLVMVLPGKSKAETLSWFAIAKDLLEPGGRLIAAMPNTAGAARFEKHLSRASGNIVSIQKHKCRVFHAALDHADEVTFNEWRALGELRRVSGFAVQAGIFSSDHTDPGSQLLADHLPSDLHGSVADLGAGWGFLSDAVLKNNPQIRNLDLFETDARALDCARQNLGHHQREIRFHWHDVTSGLPATYDAIVMNPPFHSGQATDLNLGRAFVHIAAKSLNPGGRLFLVANRQLPYEAALAATGLTFRKVAENESYKIFFAEKHPSPLA